jgi:hypothetical protein
MFVKLLAGGHAGEVVDMKYADAKILVDQGRAERVNFDRPEPEAELVPPLPPARAAEIPGESFRRRGKKK